MSTSDRTECRKGQSQILGQNEVRAVNLRTAVSAEGERSDDPLFEARLTARVQRNAMRIASTAR